MLDIINDWKTEEEIPNTNRGQPKNTDGFKGFHIMKYSSQIVIKKLDNKFIFNNKDDVKNLPQLMIEGKLDTRVKVNVEWINDNKWVKKHYQRKGMMQIFNDLYLYTSIKRTRSFREFEILNYLVISDFSTCKPLIGWVEYIGGILYRANLITENIPGMNFNDFLASKDSVESILVRIYENIGFTMNTSGTITVGTTSIVFTEFSAAGLVTAGTGIAKAGTTVSIESSQPTITQVGTLSSLTVSGDIEGAWFIWLR